MHITTGLKYRENINKSNQSNSTSTNPHSNQDPANNITVKPEIKNERLNNDVPKIKNERGKTEEIKTERIMDKSAKITHHGFSENNIKVENQKINLENSDKARRIIDSLRVKRMRNDSEPSDFEDEVEVISISD